MSAGQYTICLLDAMCLLVSMPYVCWHMSAGCHTFAGKDAIHLLACTSRLALELHGDESYFAFREICQPRFPQAVARLRQHMEDAG